MLNMSTMEHHRGPASEPVSPIESLGPQDQALPNTTDTFLTTRSSLDARSERPAETETQQESDTANAQTTGDGAVQPDKASSDAIHSDKTPVDSTADLHDKPPQYESYPEVHYAEYTPGSQLPQVAFDHGNYPQVSYGNHPEAFNLDGIGPEVTKEQQQQQQQRTVCGLRRKLFWMLVIAAVLCIVIIAAVVGGVVGSRDAKSKPKTTFMPTTALAAVNYTESSGVQHYRVYFQAESNELYQSSWDSNTEEWHVSPLNPTGADGPDVKPGTPLAAYVYNDRMHVSIATKLLRSRN